MKWYIYHFHALNIKSESVSHYEGIVRSPEMVTANDHLNGFRTVAAEKLGCSPSEIVVNQLSFLHEVEE